MLLGAMLEYCGCTSIASSDFHIIVEDTFSFCFVRVKLMHCHLFCHIGESGFHPMVCDFSLGVLIHNTFKWCSIIIPNSCVLVNDAFFIIDLCTCHTCIGRIATMILYSTVTDQNNRLQHFEQMYYSYNVH